MAALLFRDGKSSAEMKRRRMLLFRRSRGLCWEMCKAEAEKQEVQRAGCPDEAQYVRERRLVARANSGGMTVAPGLRVT